MNRLIGVDATRGLALLGMIAVHSLYDSDARGNPTWTFTVFGGRAAAAFAVLAGVGIAFMTGRRRVTWDDAKATAAALAARALAIGGLGLALGYTDAALASVILPYLAIMFLLAIPLVFLPKWAIALIGAAAATAVPALVHVLTPHLAAPTLDNPTIGQLLDSPVRLLSELALTGEYPALPWLAYLCAGLVIGRLDLTRPRTVAGLLITGAVLAAAARAVSSVLLDRYGLAAIWAAQPGSTLTGPETAEVLALGGDGTTPASTWWWLAVAAPHTSTPFDLIGTTGSAVAVLALMLGAARLTRPWLLMPLAAAGSMTLTFYTAHMMFINSSHDDYDATTGYLVQAIAVILIGLAWRATAGRGPLEALVTSLANAARRRAIRPTPILAVPEPAIPGPAAAVHERKLISR